MIDRSACRVTTFVSVADALEGLPKFGGFCAVTVLLTSPWASCATVAVSRKVATAPTGSATVVSIDPVPLAAVQLPPPLALHVQLAFTSAAGSGSVTCTPVTSLGPGLLTVIV